MRAHGTQFWCRAQAEAILVGLYQIPGLLSLRLLLIALPQLAMTLTLRIMHTPQVWSISRFYNTPERITVLLRKLSNEIIRRCSAVINLQDVFSGEVDGAMLALRQVGISSG